MECSVKEVAVCGVAGGPREVQSVGLASGRPGGPGGRGGAPPPRGWPPPPEGGGDTPFRG